MSSHSLTYYAERALAAISLSPLEIILAILGIFSWAVFYRYFWIIYRSPFKNLPGPKSNSWLFGSFAEIIKAGPGQQHKIWMKEYGRTLFYKGILGAPRVWTADPLALKYILTHANDFPKDENTRESLAEILGKGLLFAEGADHTRQKKIMNPAFAPVQIRDNATPIFFSKAYELRDYLAKEVGEDENKSTRVDIYPWLGKTTLDVIGLAGFDYDFHSLSNPRNELAVAFYDMFKVGFTITPWVIAMSLMPYAKYIPSARNRAIKHSLSVTTRIGKDLVEQKKKAVHEGESQSAEKSPRGRDLLSLIVRANMDPDLKENQRMTDEEVVGQISTFMLAGQETSSTALTWTLWKLSHLPKIQEQLRKECLEVPDEQPGMDNINALPFLDAVVHESLRTMAPVPMTRRDAAVDVTLPLSMPVRGRNGQLIDSVQVPKGTSVMIPILAPNTDPAIWGTDADEFRPSRWLEAKEPANASLPGVWGNLMTFIGGPRACIGYRFALVEIKVILFVLIRSFYFDECNPKLEIEGKTSLVTRPVVKSELEKGAQMPLMMRPVAV